MKIAYPLPNAVTLIDPDYRAMHSLTQKTVTSQEHIVAVDLVAVKLSGSPAEGLEHALAFLRHDGAYGFIGLTPYLTDWCELIWTSAKTIEEGVQEWGGKIAAALEVMHSETDGEQE